MKYAECACKVWFSRNHDSGSLLLQIGLTVALSVESDLQSAALLTACHSVKVRKVNTNCNIQFS